jgi:hypothetical protein
VTSTGQVLCLDGHVLADSVLHEFEAGRGQLVCPGGAEYDRARRVFNHSFVHLLARAQTSCTTA